MLAIALLTGWIAWMLWARVTLYEVTSDARLEVEHAAYVVQAPLAGRVTATELVLARQVRAGDVLLDLDSGSVRLQAQEERARIAAYSLQIRYLRKEMEASADARSADQDASASAVDEAGARLREAEASATQSQQELDRLARLRAAGLIAERELDRGRAEARRLAAIEAGLRIAVGRISHERQTRHSDRESHLRRLESELTRLEGLIDTGSATLRRLEYEIDRRTIRAPITGRLGEVAMVRAGGVLTEGEKICTILPPGGVRAVAHFRPTAALGRIRRGQPARLRLDGFPWTQYGALSFAVARVGGEVRDGRIRVELALSPDPASRIPIQHGLPGALEVEVEHISPATLVMRNAGRMLRAPTGNQRQP